MSRVATAMKNSCTREVIAGWMVEIQLFCRTCDTAKCLRLVCGLNALGLRLLIRSQSAGAVLRLTAAVRI